MAMREVLSPRQAQANHPPLTTPQTPSYSTPARPPSEYLIEAQGDIQEAARLANTPIPDFMRALGADTSVPQVVQSVLFLAILDNLRMLNISGSVIRERLESPKAPRPAPRPARPPLDWDPTDDPLADDEPHAGAGAAYDPLDDEPGLDIVTGPNVDMKDLIKLYQGASSFIAQAAASHAPRPAIPGRHTAPSQRTQVLEAMRTRPQPNQSQVVVYPDTDDNPSPALVDADEETQAADDLAQRLANAPESLRRILRKAIGDAGLDDA